MSIKYTLAEIEALTKPCPKADANTNIQNWKVRTETPCDDCAALRTQLDAQAQELEAARKVVGEIKLAWRLITYRLCKDEREDIEESLAAYDKATKEAPK